MRLTSDLLRQYPNEFGISAVRFVFHTSLPLLNTAVHSSRFILHTANPFLFLAMYGSYIGHWKAFVSQVENRTGQNQSIINRYRFTKRFDSACLLTRQRFKCCRKLSYTASVRWCRHKHLKCRLCIGDRASLTRGM